MKRTMCATMLCLQAVALFLTTPVMLSLGEVSTGAALGVGLGLTAGSLVAAGLLRSAVGYAVGWAIQAASIGLGFVVPVMFFIGIVFAALWAVAFFLGERIDRERGQREAVPAGE